MEIAIKNMVCPRCIAAVQEIFAKLEIAVTSISLGQVITKENISTAKLDELKKQLALVGFELLDTKQSKLINAIKSIVLEKIHHNTAPFYVNFSTFLSESLAYDYAYLSRLFSSFEGKTIEQFILSQKIEKVKELLTYDELTLSEIAFQMDYSSSAHLSSQFKKITGMTPSAFKQLQKQNRLSLDKL